MTNNEECQVIVERVSVEERAETETLLGAVGGSEDPQAGATVLPKVISYGPESILANPSGPSQEIICNRWDPSDSILAERWKNLDLSYLNFDQKRGLCENLQAEALHDPEFQAPDQADEPDVLITPCKHLDREWLLGFYHQELASAFQNWYIPNPICNHLQFLDWYHYAMSIPGSPFFRSSFMISVNAVEWRKLKQKLNAVVKRSGYFLENLYISCPTMGVGDLAEILRAAPHIVRLILRGGFNPAKAEEESLPPLPYLRTLRLESSNLLSAQKLLFAYGSQVQLMSFENATFFPGLFQNTVGPFQYQHLTCLKVNAVTAKLMKKFVELNVFHKLKSLSLKFVANGEELSKATTQILELMEQSKETLEEIHLESPPGAHHMNYHVDWNEVDKLLGFERLDEVLPVPCEKLVRFSINAIMICKGWLRWFLGKCPNIEQLRFFNFYAECQKVREPLPPFVLPELLYEHYWSKYRNLSFISVMTKTIDNGECLYFKSRKAALKEIGQDAVIERYGAFPGLPKQTVPIVVEDPNTIASMFPVFLQMTDQEGRVLRSKTIAVSHAGFVYPKEVHNERFLSVPPAMVNNVAEAERQRDGAQSGVSSASTEIIDWPLTESETVLVSEFMQPARKRRLIDETTDDITEDLKELSLLESEADSAKDNETNENQCENPILNGENQGEIQIVKHENQGENQIINEHDVISE